MLYEISLRVEDLKEDRISGALSLSCHRLNLRSN